MLSLEMVNKKRTEIYCETLLGMEGISTVSFVIFAWIFAESTLIEISKLFMRSDHCFWNPAFTNYILTARS